MSDMEYTHTAEPLNTDLKKRERKTENLFHHAVIHHVGCLTSYTSHTAIIKNKMQLQNAQFLPSSGEQSVYHGTAFIISPLNEDVPWT